MELIPSDYDSAVILIEILFHYICIDIIIFFWGIILPVNRAI